MMIDPMESEIEGKKILFSLKTDFVQSTNLFMECKMREKP